MEKKFYFFLIALMIFFSCKKDDGKNMPEVRTFQATEITHNSAILQGEIYNQGNSSITERGFCYSAIPDPSINDSIINSAQTSDKFSAVLYGLSDSKTYFYKSFAENSDGISYGNELSFKTLNRSPYITILDANYTSSTNTCDVNYRVVFGTFPLLSHGLCFGLNPIPTTSDSIIDQGNNSGNFSCELTGLNLNETYYLRAFATDAGGTVYSNEIIVSTISNEISLDLKKGNQYISGDTTINIGNSICVGVNGQSNQVSGQKLTRFKFSITSNNISTTFVDSAFSSDAFTWESDLAFSGVGDARLLFELWDKGGLKSEKFFTVTIENPGTEINKYVNVEFGSWNDVVGSFFSSTEGITYTVGQTRNIPANQAKIDFLFFKGSTNANTFASPDDVDAGSIQDLGPVSAWTNKNQTRFNPTTITAAQFDAIGSTYWFPTFNQFLQTSCMSNLFNGQVFLFKTHNDKMGLVKVIDLYTRGDRAKVSVIIQQ